MRVLAMPDLPLPRLTPDNPENRLSHHARQRIARAFVEYNLILARALSAIDIGGYWNTPQEGIEKNRAALEAIRVVLRVEADEYAKLGLPGREFREIIRTKIEEFVGSLEFSHVQRDVLEAEFLWPPEVVLPDFGPGPAPSASDGDVEASDTPADEAEIESSRSIESKAGADRVERYRTTVSGLGKVEFANDIGIDPKTYRNLLKTKKASPETWLTLAHGMHMTREELLGN